jgi:hypothetical protein
MVTTSPVVEHLTKLDVAKRELREAIWLLFHERDAVAVHNLAAAAHQILGDLAQQQGMETIRNSPYIRAGKREQWITALHHPQNYLKHADRDPDAILEFNTELPHLFIIDAIQLYKQLTMGPLFLEGALYLVWFAAKYPELVEEAAFKPFIPFPIPPYFNPDDFRQMRQFLTHLPA